MSVVGKAGFVQLAMGGGQTVRALQALKECARDGHWLLLQNVHLVTPWLYTLEKELNALTGQGNGIHARFRIWLTSEAHDNFPPALLQQSLKLTYGTLLNLSFLRCLIFIHGSFCAESPPGLRENLLRTVSAWTPALLQGSGASAQSNLRAQMLFVLAWFHAVVQERRTFIPQVLL
jgi:dynein heavy chain 2